MRTWKVLAVSSLFLLFAAAPMALAIPPEKGSQIKTETKQVLPESARARMGEIPRSEEQNKLVLATQVYKAIIKNENGEVPRSVLEKARCVAVFPGVISGAAVIGGSHGSGISSCRTQAGNWSKPAFIDISTASVGVQLGAKSSDLVLYMLSPQAENALKTGKITLGTDTSITLGTYGKAVDTNTTNIVAYEKSEGGMLGMSLTGSTLSRNDNMNRNYYGRNVDFVELLEDRANVQSDTNISSFISALPVHTL